MPKIFVLRHQLAEQQARLKSQAKGSSGDSPTSGASDEEKLEHGPSSSSGDNCASDSRPNVTSQNYIVQNAVQRMDESDKSVSENNGSDNKNKDQCNITSPSKRTLLSFQSILVTASALVKFTVSFIVCDYGHLLACKPFH